MDAANKAKDIGRKAFSRLPVGVRRTIRNVVSKNGGSGSSGKSGEVAQLNARLGELESHLARQRSAKAPVGKPGVPDKEVRAEISKIQNWYHTIQVSPGIFTPGSHNSDKALEAMGVPEDLSGKRLLDIGARDGYFSFVGEDRGADVLAIDAVAPNLTGFDTASRLMGSKVEYRTMNVYDLAPESVGEFEAIFFLGVLYHLRDPMLALDKIWSVAKPGAMVWVESHVIDHGLVDPATGEHQSLREVAPNLVDVPIAQFYPGAMLGGTATNWWAPNLVGLKAMIESAGFAVERAILLGGRGIVVGRKVENEETDFYRWYDRGVVNDRKYQRA